jgi:hypothetical protein
MSTGARLEFGRVFERCELRTVVRIPREVERFELTWKVGPDPSAY